jgi:hypothetical protein
MKIGDKIKYVDESCDSFTHGKIYTITGFDSCGDPEMYNDNAVPDCYYTDSFECITASLSFSDAIALIGTKVQYKDKPFLVEAVTVFNKYYGSTNATIKSEVKEHGYSIVLENDDDFAPLSEVEVIPMVIDLTDDYNAVIDGDNVVVGCQTIPIQKVRDILDLYERYNK